MFHRAYYGGTGMAAGRHVVVSFTGDAPSKPV
jgi:hypothetical protein